MLTEPTPPATEPYAMGIWHYARGARVRRAAIRSTRAEAELAALEGGHGSRGVQDDAEGSAAAHESADRVARSSRASSRRAAASAGRRRCGCSRKRWRWRMRFPYNEPPVWHQPPRQVLGALLLEAGRASEAEAVYREDLERVPRERLVAVRPDAESRGAGRDREEAAAVGARGSRRRGRAPTSR